MPYRPGVAFLHTPGPTHIPDRILNAMHCKAVDHGDPAFVAMAQSCFEDMKALFGTSGRVFIYASSGHGAWQGAIANLFAPGDTVLMLENGRFSRAWAEMAGALGVKVEMVSSPWGRPGDPVALCEALQADTERKFKAVLMIHTETATGVTTDIGAIRRAINEADHPALLAVDAVASWLTVPLEMDSAGVDLVVSATQKGLMMPPGMSFLAVGEKALAAGKRLDNVLEYWSWGSRMGSESYRWFCGTPPLHMLFGLREAIDIVNEESLPAMIARHRRLTGGIHACIECWSQSGVLSFNVPESAERAVSLTVVRVEGSPGADRIREAARDLFDIVLGSGLAELEGKVFRIGHMGDLNVPMVMGMLGGLEAVLSRLSVPHASGLAAAAAHFATTAPEGLSGTAV